VASDPTSAEPREGPTSLRSRAMEDLRYIRETIASATRYTAFSGKGLMIIGFGAFVAGTLASRTESRTLQSRIWLADAVISVVVGVLFGLRKARASHQSLLSGPIRKFTLSFAPVIVAGVLVTAALLRVNETGVLPGTWLCLYGAAITAAGTSSALPVPIMGISFLTLGTLGLLGPIGWGNDLMIAGFGGLQLIFGGVIARRHGG
jgi:hypothetical protein